MRQGFNIGCLIKIIVLLCVVMGIFFLVLQCGGNSCIRKIDKTLPDVADAPWEVTTPTHLYYTGDALDNGNSVTMSNWYEQIDGKWVKREGSITLERKIYGRIDVKRR